MEAWEAEYIGIPFLPRGRTREGLDCWGLVTLVFREQMGIELPEHLDGYEDTRDVKRTAALIQERMDEQWNLIEGRPRPGDCYLFRLKGLPCHVGLVICEGWFLHADYHAGVVRERVRSSVWANRLLGAYRHAKLT